MFDGEKPMTEQILDEMKKQGYDDKAIDYARKAIDYARKKISPEGEQDLDYAMGLVNVLTMKMIGETILGIVDADEETSSISNEQNQNTDGKRD
jgi:hypothetical protein